MTHKIDIRTLLANTLTAQNIRVNDAVLDSVILDEVATMVANDPNIMAQIMTRVTREKDAQIKAKTMANETMKISLDREMTKNRQFAQRAAQLGQMLDDPQAHSEARKTRQTTQQPKAPRDTKASPNPTLADALRQLLKESPNMETPFGQRQRFDQRPTQEAGVDFGNIHITFVDPTEMANFHDKGEDEGIMNEQELLNLLGEQGFEVVFMNR